MDLCIEMWENMITKTFTVAISGVGIYFLPYTLPRGDEDKSETHPAWQALTVSGRQEDTTSYNIYQM